jgi:HAD superfamily hydrolase (TIGR01509 family)
VKKYILFDHDGVLVDTEHWYYQANLRALAEVGIAVTRDAYVADMAVGKSAWEQAHRAGVDAAAISAARQRRDRYYQEHLTTRDIEISGVLDTLQILARRYRMAIVTTSKRRDFELIHKSRRIATYMDFVLTVEDYERAKPDPEPYLAGLERFGAGPSEAVVVEDSARGLASAVAARIDCIVVKNDFTASHDFSAATMRIQSLSDLPAAIEALAEAPTHGH